MDALSKKPTSSLPRSRAKAIFLTPHFTPIYMHTATASLTAGPSKVYGTTRSASTIEQVFRTHRFLRQFRPGQWHHEQFKTAGDCYENNGCFEKFDVSWLRFRSCDLGNPLGCPDQRAPVIALTTLACLIRAQKGRIGRRPDVPRTGSTGVTAPVLPHPLPSAITPRRCHARAACTEPFTFQSLPLPADSQP
jgi:hypothetical protein